MSVSRDDHEQFERDGWIAPIDVLSEAEAARYAEALADAERRFPEHLHAEHRNNAHLAFPFLAELCTQPIVVAAAQALVGDDVTLWSTVLFVKEPDSTAYVSWHQDAFYMGLEPDNFVTAWLALTPSTVESGCVSVIPGSHRARMAHVDTFGDDNILTRGQQAQGVDTNDPVHLELRPGQMSLHHPWLVHGSQPNRSSSRRIGFAMQAFLGGDVRPVRGEHHVMHIAGAPIRDEFTEAHAPAGECTEEGVERRARANAALASVLYDGASERRRL